MSEIRQIQVDGITYDLVVTEDEVSATTAKTNALKAEGYAVGKQNGTSVSSGSTYYHNNASYYASQASSSASTATTRANTATSKATEAADNALTSEGYALGTQNGTSVTSGSTYYHNNAQYYANRANTYASNASTSASTASTNASTASAAATSAEYNKTLAQDAAARAEAAVPAGTEGAVFFSVAQTLTDAQKARARANIGATSAKDNLLDNWYFVGGGSQQGGGQLPINQRGETSYTNSGYTIDRWYLYNNYISVTVDSDCIVLTNATSNTGSLRQKIGGHLVGTYTLSALVKGKGRIGFIQSDSTSIYYQAFDNTGTNWALVTFTRTFSTATMEEAIIGCDSNNSAQIMAVQLEAGSVSTLSVNSDAPLYSEELLRCTFSGVDPKDGYANRTYEIYNENLLDNPYFVGGGSQQTGLNTFPINQRRSTNYTGPAYCVDRWHIYNPYGSVSLNSNYLTFITAEGGSSRIEQFLDLEYIAGTKYTFSAIVKSAASVTLRIRNANSYKSQAFTVSEDEWTTIFITSTPSAKLTAVEISIPADSSVDIKAVKLEFGSTSTISNEIPRTFSEELQRCTNSTADATDRYANLPYAGHSNTNLLDNWYFVGGGSQQAGHNQLPVNQRGGTEFSGTGYYIDRWRSSNTYGTLKLYMQYVRIAPTSATGTYAFLRQYLNSTITKGTSTLSVYAKGTGTFSLQFYNGGSALGTRSFTINNSSTFELFTGSITVSSSVIDAVGVRVDAGSSIDLEAIKLEIGSVSTLPFDLPPTFKDVLFACKTSTADTNDTYANMPVVTSEELASKASINSPAFTGTPTSVTPNVSTNDTTIATTAYVKNQIISHPNKVLNWYLIGSGARGYWPINQRGQSSYTLENNVTTRTIDMWRGHGYGTITLSSTDGITLTSTSAGSVNFRSKVYGCPANTYTFSALIKGTGSGYIGITDTDESSSVHTANFDNPGNNWTLVSVTYTITGSVEDVIIRIPANNSISIKAVKLEVGPYSTLLNDTPDNYAEQLAKCQRYFIRFYNNSSNYVFLGTAIVGSSSLFASVPTPVTMRTSSTATAEMGGTVYFYTGSGNAITSIDEVRFSSNAITLRMTPTTTVTTGTMGMLILSGTSAYIDVSCEA